MFTLHLLSCFMFDWLYVLSTINFFIIAFYSTISDVGNSILKDLNIIRFLSLSLAKLCEIFWTWARLLFSKYYQFHVTECQRFHSHWVKASISLILTWYTFFSLWVSCIHPACWGSDLICAWLLKLWYPALKWFYILHVLDVLPNARYFLCICATPQYLQFSAQCSFSVLLVTVCHLSWLLTLLYMVKVFHAFYVV